MSSIRIPQNPNQVFAKKYDEVGAGISYFGEAAVGSAPDENVWRIQKIVETGSDIEITWASGNCDFDKIWDNRASLTYV